MDNQFSKKIVFFSFYQSILMICYHANADVHFKNIIKGNEILDKISGIIDRSLSDSKGTFFFVMLSGFLLYYNLTDENMRDKLLRRIKTLIIPWIMWNIIGTISYYHDWNKGITHILICFVTSRYCEALWFVQMLVIMLLFMPVIRKVFSIKYVREVILICLFLIDYLGWPFLQGINIFPSSRFEFEVMRMLTHVPVYCFGAYVGLNWSNAVLKESYNKYKGWVKILAAVLLILPIFVQNTFVQYFWRRYQSVFIWLLLDKNIFTFKYPWWMQISFYTYAIHNFILYWEGKILKLSGLFAEKFDSSTVSINFALIWRMSLSTGAFIATVISAFILMKFTPKFYELLSGGRVPKRNLEDKRNAEVTNIQKIL
ncbi:hypothetical protein D5282_05915 [bacterium 1xD8-48]|nr:hypothetical protein [bacterium 1xD8-48]